MRGLVGLLMLGTLQMDLVWQVGNLTEALDDRVHTLLNRGRSMAGALGGGACALVGEAWHRFRRFMAFIWH